MVLIRRNPFSLFVTAIIVFSAIYSTVSLALLMRNAGDVDLLSKKNIRLVSPDKVQAGDSANIDISHVGRALLSRLTYRFQVKYENGPWMPVGDFSTALPRYVFEKEGLTHLHIDVRDIQNGRTKGVWLGTYNVEKKIGNGGMSAEEAINRLAADAGNMERRQMLCLLLIFLFGLSILYLVKETIGIYNILILSFPLGIAFWNLLSLLFLLLKIPFNGYSSVISRGLIIAIAVFIGIQRKLFGRKDVLRVFCAVLFFSCMSYAAVKLNYSVLSYDSYFYVMLGKNLANYQRLTPLLAEYSNSYGIFVPLVHSNASLFGFDYFYSFQPMLAFSFLLFVFYALYRELKKYDFSQVGAAFWSLLAIVGFYTVYFTIFQSFWIMPNFVAAVYFFISLEAMRKAISGNEGWLPVGCLALVSFAVTRIETSFFALIIMTVYFSHQGMNKRNVLFFYFPYFFVVTFWVVRLWSYFIGDPNYTSEFLDTRKVLIILGSNILFLLMNCLAMIPSLSRFRKYSSIAMLWGLACLTALLVALKPSLAVINFKILVKNMFVAGYWDTFWVMCGILAIMSLFISKFEGESIYSVTIVAYFFFLYNTLLFKSSPLRLGFGDSGNRVLVHIAPIVVYYLALKYGHALKKSCRRALMV